MTLAVWFWLFFVLWIVLGMWWGPTTQVRAVSVILAIIVLILGLHSFGVPIHG